MEARAITQDKSGIEATPFGPARVAFEALVASLQAGPTMTMTQADVERHIRKEGRELMRLLMQANLNERAPSVVDGGSVKGRDGVERAHHREGGRPLRTLVGNVRVERMGYGAREAASLHPLDGALNLPSTDEYSHALREGLAEQVAKQSFDSAVESVERLTGAHVPKRQAEELTQQAARDFEDFYAAREAKSASEARQTSELLVLSSDAKGIDMRNEALRPDTQQAALLRTAEAARRFDLGLPKNPDPRTDGKRMAQVAAVYTIERFVRTPEDVVGELRHEPHAVVVRPRPEEKRLWASVVEDPLTVIENLFAEALRRDPKLTKDWLVLVDGNEKQLEIFESLAKAYGVEPTIILDFIHVADYVWKAGFTLHGRGTDAAAKWVRKRLGEILRGKSSSVAAGMRRSATHRGWDAKQRAPIDKCADYLLKYGQYLRYHDYLAAGYPIATGVIEGACRYLVQDRLGITGALWGLESAEAVLRLRAIAASGDIDAYWVFHERAEQQRNHANLYAGGVLPELVIPGTRPNLHLVP